MKKLFIIIICFLSVSGIVSAIEDFEQIDELISEKEFSEAKNRLESSGLSRVGIGIRQSIILLEEETSGYDWSDLSKDEKNKLIEVYEQALEIINEIFRLPEAENDPETHRLYFYRAFYKTLIAGVKRNMGFLSEIKHIFEDLGKSLELEPDFPDSVFFAAGLYQFLPGWPISRGSNEKAISWYRYGLGILEENPKDIPGDQLEEIIARNQLSLAQCLAERDWKADKRKKEQEKFRNKYSNAEDITEEIDFYEGITVLENISDMEEAKRLYEKAEYYYLELENVTDENFEEVEALLKSVYQKLDQ